MPVGPSISCKAPVGAIAPKSLLIVTTLALAVRMVLAIIVTVSVLLAQGYGVVWPIIFMQKNGAWILRGSESPCVVICPSGALSLRPVVEAATAFRAKEQDMQHNTDELSLSIGIPYPGVEHPSELAIDAGSTDAVLGGKLESAANCSVPARSEPI